MELEAPLLSSNPLFPEPPKPLPGGESYEQRLAYAAETLGPAEAAASAAVSEQLDGAAQRLGPSDTEANILLSTLVGATSTAVDRQLSDAEARVAGVARQVEKVIGPAESELSRAGVESPYSHYQRVADLGDETGDAMLRRIPQFALLMGDEKPLPEPPPIEPVDDLRGPGPSPPPPPGPTFPPGIPPSCPPGTIAVFDNATGGTYCLPLPPPPPPPPGPTPPSPPTLPPVPPPPVPPPPLPGGDCGARYDDCGDRGKPAVLLSRQCVQVEREKKGIWVRWRCYNQCTIEYEVYEGDAPPDLPGGWPGAGWSEITPYLRPDPMNPGQSWLSLGIDKLVREAAICAGYKPAPGPLPTVPLPPPPPPTLPPPPAPPTVPPPPPPGEEEPKPEKPKVIKVEPYNEEGNSKFVCWDKPTSCDAATQFLSEVGRSSAPDDDDGSVDAFIAPFQVESSSDGLIWRGIKALVPTLGLIEAGSVLWDAAREKALDNTIGLGMLKKALGAVLPGCVKNFNAAVATGARLALAHKVEANTGFPATYMYQSDVYLFQYANPQYIPTQAELNNLVTHGRMTWEAWDCYTRANGNIPELQEAVARLGDVRPNPNEIIQLYRRGILSTDKEFYRRMKDVGISDQGHAREFYKLSEVVPPYTDLIRFMVRDATDKRVYEKYNYDKGFVDKYKGQIEKWGHAQGMTEDVFKTYWRAHWDIPSNTALYNMLHRLRPDRKEVRNYTPAAVGPNQPPPSVVTIEDVRQAIEVNDMAPAWVQPLLDISYHPLTRTDAVRAYTIGSLDSEDLYETMRDNGYNDKDARALVKFYTQLKAKSVSSNAGLLSPRAVVRAYQDGSLRRGDAFDLLEPYVAEQRQREFMLDQADRQTEIGTTQALVKAAKKRYLFGEWDDDEADTALGTYGVEGLKRMQLLRQWEAEKFGRLKEPRVQMLCQWHTHGFITADQYYDRLTRLGYTGEDAARIVGVCQQDFAEKKAKEAAAAAEKRRKEEGRKERERIKREKEAAEGREKAEKEREKAAAGSGGKGG